MYPRAYLNRAPRKRAKPLQILTVARQTVDCQSIYTDAGINRRLGVLTEVGLKIAAG